MLLESEKEGKKIIRSLITAGILIYKHSLEAYSALVHQLRCSKTRESATGATRGQMPRCRCFESPVKDIYR